jgi:hypothetical protein
MPFALLTIGAVLIITGINNTWQKGPGGQGNGLFPQLYQDIFTESGGYLYWVSALVIVGFIGYIPQLRKPADAFMTLILVAMILKNNGFFAQLESALQNVSSTNAVNTAPGTGSVVVNNSGTTASGLPFDAASPVTSQQFQSFLAANGIGGAASGQSGIGSDGVASGNTGGAAAGTLPNDPIGPTVTSGGFNAFLQENGVGGAGTSASEDDPLGSSVGVNPNGFAGFGTLGGQ